MPTGREILQVAHAMRRDLTSDLSLEHIADEGPRRGAGEFEVGELQGGPVATAVHVGPYDTLSQTHAAVERWIAEHGYRPNGAPWEPDLTDPGEEPDPAKWRTQVVWPIAS